MSDPKIVVEGEVKHRENRKVNTSFVFAVEPSNLANLLTVEAALDNSEKTFSSRRFVQRISLFPRLPVAL